MAEASVSIVEGQLQDVPYSSELERGASLEVKRGFVEILSEPHPNFRAVSTLHLVL